MEIFTHPSVYCFSMWQGSHEYVQLIGFYFDGTKRCKSTEDFVDFHEWIDKEILERSYPFVVKLK